MLSLDGGDEDDGGVGTTGGTGSTDGPGADEGGAADGDTAADGPASDDAAEPPVVFDLGHLPDVPTNNNCGAPLPVSCDDADTDPMHALGLNCPGGPQVDGVYNGGVEAMFIHQGNLGTSAPPAYPPREGERFIVMSTGIATQILTPGMFTSSGVSSPDPGFALPAPLVMAGVDATDDCADDPTLVGTGECSNTLQNQWNQGEGANDYAEIRINTEVPAGTFGFSYEFAFFSEEYPIYFETEFNDMYVAWLESEQWTGNISFDEMGNPISLNAGFLDNLPGSPELAGTSMDQNAGTKWLVTTAGVTPGEQIEIVFAVWDLSDDIWDTTVILDNFLWECEGGPPVTIPG